MKKYAFISLSIILLISGNLFAQVANPETYLSALKKEMQIQWPQNRTLNIIFHGHSVPSGYFVTPVVNTLEAYPHLTLIKIKELYPYTVTNCIVTAIGGENSEQGAKRFKKDVLSLNPDVIFIDYALNDRGIGLDKARKAWESMIKKALRQNIPVVLLTPTPDKSENILDPENILAKHSEQIRELAKKYKVGLVDSYEEFRKHVKNGEPLDEYMSQVNHPNRKGHELVTTLIMNYLIP